jgi:hypothetical protein
VINQNGRVTEESYNNDTIGTGLTSALTAGNRGCRIRHIILEGNHCWLVTDGAASRQLGGGPPIRRRPRAREAGRPGRIRSRGRQRCAARSAAAIAVATGVLRRGGGHDVAVLERVAADAVCAAQCHRAPLRLLILLLFQLIVLCPVTQAIANLLNKYVTYPVT